MNGARNSWVDVDTGERCLSDGVPMFWLGYNPNHQILQTPDHVVIVHEMFRDRRIIPLADGPRNGIRQWNGDMHGRWDGDTLVVESTHFIDGGAERWAADVADADAYDAPRRALHPRRCRHSGVRVHPDRSREVHLARGASASR